MLSIRSIKLTALATLVSVGVVGCSGGGSEGTDTPAFNNPGRTVTPPSNSTSPSNPRTPITTPPLTGSNDPSNQEILDAINDQTEELKGDIKKAEDEAKAAKEEAMMAKDEAKKANDSAEDAEKQAKKAKNTALWTGIIGGLVGAAGLGVGIWNLNRQTNNKKEIKEEINTVGRHNANIGMANLGVSGENQRRITGLADRTRVRFDEQRTFEGNTTNQLNTVEAGVDAAGAAANNGAAIAGQARDAARSADARTAEILTAVHSSKAEVLALINSSSLEIRDGVNAQGEAVKLVVNTQTNQIISNLAVLDGKVELVSGQQRELIGSVNAQSGKIDGLSTDIEAVPGNVVEQFMAVAQPVVQPPAGTSADPVADPVPPVSTPADAPGADRVVGNGN